MSAILNRIVAYFRKRPAIGMAIIWLTILVLMRAFTVSVMHQHGFSGQQPKIPSVIQGAIKWDGSYYLSIAQKGYIREDITWIAFYPLYPLLIRLLHAMGLGWVLAGLVINAVALIFSCHGLYVLTLLIAKSKKIATYAVAAWLSFPAAHFLAAYYTEALFSALAVWCLVLLLRKHYLGAILLAGLASATRLPGITLGVAIAIQYMEDSQWRWPKINWKILVWPLSFGGIIAYWSWLYYRTGVMPHRLMRQAYAAGWGYMRMELNILKTYFLGIKGLVTPMSAPWTDDKISGFFNQLQGLAGWSLIAGSSIVAWLRKYPISLYVYTGLAALLLIISGNFISHLRYALPIFPIFIIVAIWLEKRSEVVRIMYFISSSVCMAAMMTMFVNGYWVV